MRLEAKRPSYGGKNEKKILIILLLTFCIFLKSEVITSFNEKLYNDVDDWMYDDFLKENRISKVKYINENWNSKEDSYDEKYERFPDAPKERIIIISNEEEYDNIFEQSKATIDFDSQIPILYTFCSTYPRKCHVSKIKLVDDVLNIKIAYAFRCFDLDSSNRYQKWVLVMIDKVEFSSVEFERLKN